MIWSEVGEAIKKTEFRINGTKSIEHIYNNPDLNQILLHTVFQPNGITLKSTATATGLPHPNTYLVSIFNKFGVKQATFHSPRIKFLTPETSPRFIKNRYQRY
jgi:hypothetical protein